MPRKQGRSPRRALPLSPIYDLILAQEEGQWEEADNFSAQLHLPDGFAADTQWSVMQWAKPNDQRGLEDRDLLPAIGCARFPSVKSLKRSVRELSR